MLLRDLPWGWIYYVSEWVIRIGMLFVIPFRRSPDAAKGWLLLVFFQPWIGLVFYFIIGRPKLPDWVFARSKKFMDEVEPALAQHASITGSVSELAPHFVPVVNLAKNLGRLPIVKGNTSEILVDYARTIELLVEEIDRAKHHVHLLFYIFFYDKVGTRVVDALARATKRGVKCRVLVDAVGSGKGLKVILAKLKEAGVESHAILPLSLMPTKFVRPDLRNHRKIAVMDGQVAFTGSMNLVDPTFKAGIVYEELVVRVRGPLVLELQLVFSHNWYVETAEVIKGPEYFPSGGELPGTLMAQALPSGPAFPTQNNQRLMVALIYAAEKRIIIVTPYFIPDEGLLQALETALRRGVEVHLVFSEMADQLLVCLAQKSYYEQLLEMGAKVHLYTEKFLHAKCMTIDGMVCLIGSSNMDIRSFTLNAEISVFFLDKTFTAGLVREQERYFKGAKLLTLETWEKRSRFQQTKENVARLISPLL